MLTTQFPPIALIVPRPPVCLVRGRFRPSRPCILTPAGRLVPLASRQHVHFVFVGNRGWPFHGVGQGSGRTGLDSDVQNQRQRSDDEPWQVLGT